MNFGQRLQRAVMVELANPRPKRERVRLLLHLPLSLLKLLWVFLQFQWEKFLVFWRIR
jgi:hypothetical protein